MTRHFNPTHEFRGLPLKSCGVDYESGLNTWVDEEDNQYHIPVEQVTKIIVTPEPGEVWRYVDPTASAPDPYPLVLITDDGDGFRCADSSRESLMIPYDLKNLTKILNADGSPA